jgi:hypothetical protein
LTYSVDLTNCDGTSATIVSTRTCSVPITSLMASPFSLPWGSSVVATVSALNVYGSSLTSSPTASGAIILTIPDAPLNLANNLLVTFGTSIGLTWSPGTSNGGTPVIDYTLWSDAGSNGITYQPVVTSLTSTSYTVTGLGLGITYTFRVQSRNAFGLSTFSATTSILAAQQPDIPLAPFTTFFSTSVSVTWTAPFNGGSPVTGYRV